jgi:hypothetical protein
MRTTIQQTRDTMAAMGQPTPDKVTYAPEVQEQRLALILEELSELAVAYGRPRQFAEMLLIKSASMLEQHKTDTGKTDIVEVLDALGDLRVVCDGTVVSHGLHECFEDAMDEIKRSNDTKKVPTKERARHEVALRTMNGETGIYDKAVGNHYVLYNKQGKYLKPSFYSPANLRIVLWPHLSRSQKEQIREQQGLLEKTQ